MTTRRQHLRLGHLENIDKLSLSGQLVHELLLCRVTIEIGLV